MYNFRRLIVLFIVLGAIISSVACDHSYKEVVGTIYADEPKVDLLAEVNGSPKISFVICDHNSKTRLMMLDYSAGDIVKDQDKEIPGVVCGVELQELRRLAEIGKRYDKH